MGDRAFTVELDNERYDVWESPDSPKIQWGRNGQQITASYKCIWDELPAVMIALCGTTRTGSMKDTGSGAPVGFLSRLTPHAYPGFPLCYAESITNERSAGPRGQADEGNARAALALFDCIYRPSKFLIIPDRVSGRPTDYDPDGKGGVMRYISRRRSRQLTELTYNAGDWKWLEGPHAGKAVPARITLPIRRGVLLLTWHDVPLDVLPDDTISDGEGKVNADPFETFAAGTLRFDGTDYEPVTLPDMTIAANLTYHWSINQDSWLKMPNPKADNVYYLVGKDLGGVNLRLYKSFDFSKLFIPNPG